MSDDTFLRPVVEKAECLFSSVEREAREGPLLHINGSTAVHRSPRQDAIAGALKTVCMLRYDAHMMYILVQRML
jgi:hypothetical protein